ncbi:unnamed protein product [Gongylonema pulchrum]|uniref:Transposase n=1 Tax=Gongylonema pulchrum TaxID=637853 RepID=A0A183E6T8_9BILA|nr:unnamed protein product [Gongylonema pulchrum]
MALLDLDNVAPHLERNSILSIPEYRIKDGRYAVSPFSLLPICLDGSRLITVTCQKLTLSQGPRVDKIILM